MKKLLKIIFYFLIFFTWSVSAWAERHVFSVEGVARDAEDKAVTGTYTLTLNLYSKCSDTDPIFTDKQAVEFSSEGVFSASINLTSLTPDQTASINQSETTCLGIQFDGDTELSPRLEYSSTPYAHLAESADSAEVANLAKSVDPSFFSSILGQGLKYSGSMITLDTGSTSTWSGPQTYQGQVVLSKSPLTVSSANASLLINPTSAADNAKLFVIQDNGTDLFTVTKEGNVSLKNVNVAGNMSFTNGGITLGTDTQGNYVSTITGDSNISVSGSGTESAAVSMSLNNHSIDFDKLNTNLTLTAPTTINMGDTNAWNFRSSGTAPNFVEISSAAGNSFSGLSFQEDGLNNNISSFLPSSLWGLIIPVDSVHGGTQLFAVSDGDISPLKLTGILGSTNPAFPAIILGAVKSNGAGGMATLDSNDIVLKVESASTGLVVLGNGNVGIGLDSPGVKLQVAGEILSSCKTGYSEKSHYCIETDENAGGAMTWSAAVIACNTQEARLCSPAELRGGLDFTSGTVNGDWVDNLASNTNAFVIGHGGPGIIENDSIINPHTFRCCYSK